MHMKQSKRLFSFTARSIMALRFHKEEFACPYEGVPQVYTQIDILFWIPFTPIFFVYKIDIIRGAGVEDPGVEAINNYWKSPKSLFSKLPCGIYRVYHDEMYKRKPRRCLPMLPGKKSTLAFVREEDGIPFYSPRNAALKWLERHNYVSKEAVLNEFVQ